MLASDSTLALGGAIVSGIFGFVLVVIATRGMGAAEAGRFLQAVALVSIFAGGLELGADTGLVRSVSALRAEDRPGDSDAVVRIALVPVAIISAATAVLLFAFAPNVADLLSRSDPSALAGYLRAMTPFVPAAVVMLVALAATRGAGTMRPYVLVANVAVPSLRPLLLALTLGLGLGEVASGLAWSIPLGLGALLALAALWTRVTSRDRLLRRGPGDRILASEFWRFTAPRGLAAFLQIVVIWIDIILVGALRSAREAGIYAAASRALLVGTVAMQAISLAIGPLVGAAFARGDREGVRSLYRASAYWLVVLSWPFYLVLAVFGPLVLRIFGRGFDAGAEALVLLCIGIVAQVGTGSNKVILLMAGHSGWNVAITAISLVVNVSLNLALIPRYGITGAAAAWAVTFFVDNFLSTMILHRLNHLDPFGRGYLVATTAAFGCFGVLGLLARAVAGATATGLLLFAAIAVPLYLVILWKNREALRLEVLIQMVRRRSAVTSEAQAAAPAEP